MRTITATEASRHFSDLLDAIEAGESVQVTRGNKVVAELRPATARKGRELREALATLPALDEHFERDIAGAMELLTPWQEDPWAES